MTQETPLYSKACMLSSLAEPGVGRTQQLLALAKAFDTNGCKGDGVSTTPPPPSPAESLAQTHALLPFLLAWLGGSESHPAALENLVCAFEHVAAVLHTVTAAWSRPSQPAAGPDTVEHAASCAAMALGAPGSKCALHLSEQPTLLTRWIQAQLSCLEAAVCSPIALRLPPGLASNLWSTFRGNLGLGSSFAEVRAAAIRLVCRSATLAAPASAVRTAAGGTSAAITSTRTTAPSSPPSALPCAATGAATGAAGIKMGTPVLGPGWSACFHVLTKHAAHDPSPSVRAAALTAAAPILAQVLLHQSHPSEAGSTSKAGAKEAAAALSVVLAALSDPDSGVRAAARTAAGCLPVAELGLGQSTSPCTKGPSSHDPGVLSVDASRQPSMPKGGKESEMAEAASPSLATPPAPPTATQVSTATATDAAGAVHPAVQSMLAQLLSAPSHTDGPLAASKDPSTLVAAATGLLSLTFHQGLVTSQEALLGAGPAVDGMRGTSDPGAGGGTQASQAGGHMGRRLGAGDAAVALATQLLPACIALDTHAARVLVEHAAQGPRLPTASVREEQGEEEAGCVGAGDEGQGEGDAWRFGARECRRVRRAVQVLWRVMAGGALAADGGVAAGAGAGAGGKGKPEGDVMGAAAVAAAAVKTAGQPLEGEDQASAVGITGGGGDITAHVGVSVCGDGPRGEGGSGRRAHMSLEHVLLLLEAAARELPKAVAGLPHSRVDDFAPSLECTVRALAHIAASLPPAGAPGATGGLGAAGKPGGPVQATGLPSAAGGATLGTRDRFLGVAEALVALCEQPSRHLYEDAVGALGQPETESAMAESEERRRVAGWALLALSHIAGCAVAGVQYPPPTQAEAGGQEPDSQCAATDGDAHNSSVRVEPGGGVGGSAGAQAQDSPGARHGHGSVVIEEIDDTTPCVQPSDAESERRKEAQASQLAWAQRSVQLVDRMLLLCATVGADEKLPTPWAASACANDGDDDDGGDLMEGDGGAASHPSGSSRVIRGPEGALGERGGEAGAAGSAREGGRHHTHHHHAGDPTSALLAALAASLQLPKPKHSSPGGAPSGGSSALVLMGATEVRQQQLLAAAASREVPIQRRVLASGPTKANYEADQGVFSTTSGPSVFERALAARRIAWFVRRLRHPHLSAATPVLLAGVLTTFQDPTPSVAAYGATALQHLATEGLAADLRWPSALLSDVVLRMLLGCDEALWPAAAPAAVCVMAVLEGNNPRATGYHTLMTSLLTEVERGAHKQAVRGVFLSLDVLHKLVGCMGLTVVRHMARLLPLLLEWLQSHDAPSRAAAASCLHCLIIHTWPRMPAHAPLLWEHLAALLVREMCERGPTSHTGGTDGLHITRSQVSKALDGAPPGSPAAHAAACLHLLAQCGGPAFQQAVKQSFEQLSLIKTAEAANGVGDDEGKDVTQPPDGVAAVAARVQGGEVVLEELVRRWGGA